MDAKRRRECTEEPRTSYSQANSATIDHLVKISADLSKHFTEEKEQRARAEKRNGELETEVSQLKERIKVLEKELNKAGRKEEELLNKLQAAHTVVYEFTEDINDNEMELWEMKEKIERAEAQAEIQSVAFNQKEEELSSTYEKLHRASGDLQRFHQKLDRTAERLDRASHMLQRTEEKLHGKSEELHQKSEEFKQKSEELQTISEERDYLLEHRDYLLQQLDNIRSGLAESANCYACGKDESADRVFHENGCKLGVYCPKCWDEQKKNRDDNKNFACRACRQFPCDVSEFKKKRHQFSGIVRQYFH